MSAIQYLDAAAALRIAGIGFAYAYAGQDMCKRWEDVRLVFLRDHRRRDVMNTLLRQELGAAPKIRADMIPAYLDELALSFDNASPEDWLEFGLSMNTVGEFAQLSPALQRDLLRFTDASVSDLRALTLHDVDLRNIDFRSGDFNGADWCEVDARYADFTGANLSRARLRGVSFGNARLRDAQLEGLQRMNVDFSGADLSNATLSLDTDWLVGTPETVSQAMERINHLLTEDNGWEFLASIASIENCHGDLKRAVMCQLIEALETLSISEETVWSFMASWVSVLSDPVFWESPLISAFINAYLPVGIQAKWNHHPVPKDLCVDRLSFHMRYLLEMSDHPQWAVLHQGAIHQLVLRARETPQLGALGNELLEHYLRHPSIASAARALENVLADTSRDTCIFLSEDTHSAVACTPGLLKAVIDNEDDISWHSFYVLRRTTPEAPYVIESAVSPEAALRPIPLLHAAYLAASGVEQQRFGHLLDAYWSGDEVDAKPATPIAASATTGEHADDASRLADRESYRQHALAMTTRVSSNHAEHKLTTIPWQMRLQRLFAHALCDPESPHPRPADARATVRLLPEVKAALWRACSSEVAGMEETGQNRAAFEMIEAIKQTQLASSLLLGTETESPVALRYLACALLNEVCVDDPDMVPQETLAQWRARLVGDSKELATCTATLADEMMAFVLAAPPHSPLRVLYDTLLPHAWRR